jgi:hypothetical protein
MAAADDDKYAPLTFRLAGVLELRGYGWSSRKIGDLYGLKSATVRQYLSQARRLLGSDSVDAAVEEAVRRGLIDLSGPPPDSSPPRWEMPYQGLPSSQDQTGEMA